MSAIATVISLSLETAAPHNLPVDSFSLRQLHLIIGDYVNCVRA